MIPRVVIFTVDHLEYSSLVLKPLLEKHGDTVIKIYVSKSLFDWRFLRKRFWFFIKNGYPFCIRFGDLIRYIRWRVQNSSLHGYRNMVDYLRAAGYETEYISEIQSEFSLAQIRDLRADIILFALFDKIAPQAFLNIPKIGVFNIHLGMLPEYRGGLSSFWVLRFGESVAGATMHEAVARIDSGDIIAEIRFPIRANSMKGLMDETVEKTGLMIVEGIDRLIDGNPQPIPTNNRPERYFLIPTHNDFIEFYRRGNRLI